MKYTEIFKLKEMLEAEHIPFVFKDLSTPHDFLYDLGERYQLCYPDGKSKTRICSVIEGKGTYGAEEDKLEIMGLLTDDELKHDDVVGYLTAEDVFERIKKHWNRRE